MQHLRTFKKSYLLIVALIFAILFHTSYSSIPFIILSQILWFYRVREDAQKPSLSCFLILNGLVLFMCAPWIVFLAFNYKGQALMDPFHTETPGSFFSILYGLFHDWAPYPPLMIVSVFLLIFSPIFSKFRKNALVLLSLFILPVGGLYFYCRLLNVTHFVTSRYFINFLPLFFIIIFLSLDTLEAKFERLRKVMRLKILFVILFVASNLVILPLYYRSEKQDLRGLVNYLKVELREGDKIFDATAGYTPGILHYLGAYPERRHQVVSSWKDSENKIGFRISFLYQNRRFTIFHSKTCCSQYVTDGNRLWIIVGKWSAREFKRSSPFVLKGYFDGSVLNFSKFPEDASIYLFLWDPSSPGEKGIDMVID